MYYYEVCEIGRESVKSVNASILATLIRELVNRYEKSHKSKLQPRKFYIKCKEKLEFSPKKSKKIGGDDEGFESDGNEEDSLSGDLSNEDAQSTTSSCCMVEDHVFKSTPKPEFIHRTSYGKDPTSLVSIIGSIDSANSSGSSDTDEIEVHSLTPSPITQSKKLLQKKHDYLFKTNEFDGIGNKQTKMKREEYPISDVIICHTEPKYPTVIAWVIKRPQSEFGTRLGATGVETYAKIENCLEVVVVKCKNADNLRELCSNYQEYSRRTKLDNYKSIKRKKDVEPKKIVSLSPLSDSKDVKVSLSDMKIANSGLIKASELSILNPKIITSFRHDRKNSVSLNSLIKTEKIPSQSAKTSVEIKSAMNGTLQTTVKKTQSLMNISKTWEPPETNGSLKNGVVTAGDKNSDVGEQFNLVQRTDQNGVTHIEVTKSRENKPAHVAHDRFSTKSKLRKEIEGVILTDVESYAKKEQVRQRTSGFDETGNPREKPYDCPPIRPERRKYLRKKNAAPSPPVTTTTSDNKMPSSHQVSSARDKPKTGFFLTSFHTEENHSKKDHKPLRSPFVELQTWRNQTARETNSRSWKPETRGRFLGKFEDKGFEKKRSLSAGRPPKKAPMAYRYVYLTNDYRESLPSKRGIPSKLREVGGTLTSSIHTLRRRNSFDDVITFNDANKSNLKSVIKKSKKINDKYCEPKKVTFSAFATVQVVD